MLSAIFDGYVHYVCELTNVQLKLSGRVLLEVNVNNGVKKRSRFTRLVNTWEPQLQNQRCVFASGHTRFTQPLSLRTFPREECDRVNDNLSKTVMGDQARHHQTGQDE